MVNVIKSMLCDHAHHDSLLNQLLPVQQDVLRLVPALLPCNGETYSMTFALYSYFSKIVALYTRDN